MDETGHHGSGDPPEEPPVTQWLHDASDGDEEAMARVWTWAMDDLRRLAGIRMNRELTRNDLQTTMIVNEAFLKIVGRDGLPDFDDRDHFFGAVWTVMGQLLIDHARHRGRRKRGGDHRRVDFSFAEGSLTAPERVGDAAEDIAAALDALRDHDPPSHAVAIMKLFFGTDRRHIALLHGIEPNEVDQRWRYARAFLKAHLAADGESDQ